MGRGVLGAGGMERGGGDGENLTRIFFSRVIMLPKEVKGNQRAPTRLYERLLFIVVRMNAVHWAAATRACHSERQVAFMHRLPDLPVMVTGGLAHPHAMDGQPRTPNTQAHGLLLPAH